MTTSTIIEGDARTVLATLPEASVQCVVTSPPYFALRDYGTGSWDGGDEACDHRVPRHARSRNVAMNERMGRASGQGKQDVAAEVQFEKLCGKCGARRVDDRQIGLEPTPAEFVEALCLVFDEVWRVLRDDGTVWLNLGDSYNAYNGNRSTSSNGIDTRRAAKDPGEAGGSGLRVPELKMKDRLLIPARVALALQERGWYVRADIIWTKPNPMPESVVDRPSCAHEHVFLLSKRARYFYDADAVRKPLAPNTLTTFGYMRDGDPDEQFVKASRIGSSMPERKPRLGDDGEPAGANLSDVWTIPSEPYHEAHFAVMPTALVEPCLLAGSREGDVVLDPFSGAATVGVVAQRLGRSYIGVELNPEYAEMGRRRIVRDHELGFRAPRRPRAPEAPQMSLIPDPGGTT